MFLCVVSCCCEMLFLLLFFFLFFYLAISEKSIIFAQKLNYVYSSTM